MKIIDTKISGLKIIEPKIFTDSRGSFKESYNSINFKKNFGEINFIQDNESVSKKGVLRGFHFQKPPFEQAKLVRCLIGTVIDVAVDLRTNSATFGRYEKVLLSEKNNKQLFIPRGFAHAFLVLSDYALFSYKVDNIYSPDHDSGIIWNDPELNIDWHFDKSEIIVSEKDSKLKFLKDFEMIF
jgi:dTDP-4-dehydrorhamnose 3,5-epimerase